MPRLAPVTTATLPVSLPMISNVSAIREVAMGNMTTYANRFLVLFSESSDLSI